MTQEKDNRQAEDGVDVPYERINPETLRNLIQEFVSRDGADWGDAGCSLEDKVDQVLGQLKAGKARVVFDLKTETVNIVVRS
ncbi:YheU family protein [Geoalkalibacter halelectricus]|uniref:YheU family protein n=1 Tax=Geoalkalibacter halelectricus TaxID=2847045 RepID=UPI00266E97A2|nr:YheU family protein [Geoalkalibacter halelectricus]MDO3380475.1 YheU family protein [Geoalkalibacter halelectricus]